MIRRETATEYWLVTQHDHAILSGLLARAIGGNNFGQLTDETIQAITLHDCGWPTRDETTPVSNDGLPCDVFESPREQAYSVWRESAERACKVGDYQGLLVSLHGLNLSSRINFNDPGGADARGQFALNQFQHDMIELQESLRQRLGFRTDRPLRFGLSEESAEANEQRLFQDYRWLAACDAMSLAICCTKPPFPTVDRLPKKSELHLHRSGDDLVVEGPWPFRDPLLKVEIPYRQVPKTTYSQPELRKQFDATPVKRFTVCVLPFTISE